MRQDAEYSTKVPDWCEDSPNAQEGTNVANEEDVVRFVNDVCWNEWMPAFRSWHRQVQENVRMLSGRQFERFIETVGEFIDLSEYFITPDDRWRENPVFNWLAHYYKLTLSKLTENLPAMGFNPASADWSDAQLAEIMEPYWKHQWRQMSMAEQMFPLYGWVIIAARGVTKIRWDPDRGPMEEYRADGLVEYFRNNQLTQRRMTDVPYVRNTEGLFVPNVQMSDDGNALLSEEGLPMFGEPYSSRMGDLAFDVLAPTSVISPHGPEPFHLKPWYTHEYLAPVEDVERRFDISDLEPDELEIDDIADMWLKLSYGENYGMPSSHSGESVEHVERVALRGYKRIREHWRREIPNHPVLSKGRLIVCTEDECIYDDINPFWVDGTHEQGVQVFDAFDAVPVPFRNEGMGDLEILNPIQRAFNRRLGGALDAVEFNEQPTTVMNDNVLSEEDEDKLNKPGAILRGTLTPGVGDPLWRLDPPGMPVGSVDMANTLQQWMQLLGSQPFGSEGFAATADASGELQREVRFDTDRVWGSTIRLHSYVWARIAEKIHHITAACMEDERLIVLSGEDNAAQFLTVAGEMFRGSVHAIPQPESQVLESRQEKQNRIAQLVKLGMPVEQALKALNYPDINRVLRPGGPAYSMAQRENLELMTGQAPPVLPEHDHATHLLVLMEYMQTPTFRDTDPAIQQAFRLHRFMHEQMQAQELIRQGTIANSVQGALALQQAAATPALRSAAGEGDVGGAGEGRAPSGAQLQSGAVAPGAADPRRTSISLAQ